MIHEGSRKVLIRRDPTLTTFIIISSSSSIFFLVDEGREDPSSTINGPASARQQNAIKWRFGGVSMIAQH